jgi:hypothetical protein
MKKVFIVLLALLCVAGFVFAADKTPAKNTSSGGGLSWMTSYNGKGQLNLYGSVGFYGLGVDVSVAPEYIINKFNLGVVPLEWGVTARGMVGFSSFLGYSWIDWGVAPMATLHWGVDFGAPWKFDLYVGIGAGVYGSAGSAYSLYDNSGVHVGFASFDGVAWHFSKNISLISEGGYIGTTSTWGVGAEVQF